MLSDPARWGEEGVFDPATVIGLQRWQHVLVLGNAAFLPWLTKENENIVSARKINDAVKLVQNGDFDRIVVGREFDFSHWTALAVARVGLHHQRGILVYFPKNEGDAWQFKQNIDFAFPGSRVWESNTTFGQVIQAEINGDYIDV